MEAVAAVSSMTQIRNSGEELPEAEQAQRLLAGFRGQLYGCLTARADEQFERADAVLCGDGPVRVLAGLSLVPGHRRGHGAMYDALNAGRADVRRLRWAVGCVPLPRWPDGRIRLAVDVCSWLRPDAVTSPERMFCHVHGRGRNAGQMIPGWPYSVVAALGRHSCAASISNTHSGSSSRPSAGTPRCSATRPPPTGGPEANDCSPSQPLIRCSARRPGSGQPALPGPQAGSWSPLCRRGR
jgi:hypothetical protein